MSYTRVRILKKDVGSRKDGFEHLISLSSIRYYIVTIIVYKRLKALKFIFFQNLSRKLGLKFI